MRGKKRTDYTGIKFNKLVAIKPVKDRIKPNGKRTIYWLYLCDCGEYKEINTGSVVSGHSKRCGGSKHKRGLKDGEARFNHLFLLYSDRAKNKGLDFTLTKEEFRTLTQLNCSYCNCIPATGDYDTPMNGRYIYNGIDRVDNSIGYTKENCVSCCKTCNVMKLSLTLEEFKAHIDKIYLFLHGMI